MRALHMHTVKLGTKQLVYLMIQRKNETRSEKLEIRGSWRAGHVGYSREKRKESTSPGHSLWSKLCGREGGVFVISLKMHDPSKREGITSPILQVKTLVSDWINHSAQSHTSREWRGTDFNTASPAKPGLSPPVHTASSQAQAGSTHAPSVSLLPESHALLTYCPKLLETYIYIL